MKKIIKCTLLVLCVVVFGVSCSEDQSWLNGIKWDTSKSCFEIGGGVLR